MTTLTLSIDSEKKRFERDDGPTHVHAGETVQIVLKGLGITKTAANGTNIPEGAVVIEDGDDAAAAYPSLRVRLVHPTYGDLAMYPWPSSPPNWDEIDISHPGAGLKCEIDLDTEQLFRVVRSGFGAGLLLYVERPWPETAPTVYGTYSLDVADWPEATGEMRSFPTNGRYVNAFGRLRSVQTLDRTTATLRDTIDAVNAILGSVKTLAQRNGQEG